MSNEERAFTSGLHEIMKAAVKDVKTKAEGEEILSKFGEVLDRDKAGLAAIRDPIQRAKFVHNCIDLSQEKMKAQVPDVYKEIKCKSGCSYCCHVQVSCNEEEALLILEACEKEKISIDWDRVRKQADFGRDERGFFHQPKSESRCEFLSQSNKCNIYDSRPASCRKYLVLSDPKQCDNKVDPKVQVVSDPRVEILNSALMDLDHSKTGFLPEMLLQAKELRETRNVKRN